MLTKRDFLRSAAFVATAGISKSVPASAENSVSPVEARKIAREAYVFGFPLIPVRFHRQHFEFCTPPTSVPSALMGNGRPKRHRRRPL